uniref:Uncharacterized protein n=1 Tax=Ralstonia syzygii R24 TaxID=907261 RepID=G3A2F3_9RALS|nr:hypothetical protein RALSY_20204 [Ralstonia syzygii R24]
MQGRSHRGRHALQHPRAEHASARRLRDREVCDARPPLSGKKAKQRLASFSNYDQSARATYRA